MIKHLYIKNFVLIDEVSLDFASGFSAFTGETGAGKSILIDAISLLKAERASASFVMKGKDKALIEGTFDLRSDPKAKQILADAGFDCEDEVTFTREISSSGKSTARIDHRIVTLSLMREVLADQIDIHGQRDNAYLLNTASHIHLLDEYLQDSVQLEEVRRLYDVWNNLVREKNKALEETYNENDLEYFQYQIKEIDDAGLKEGEDEELEAKEKQYNALRDSYEKLNRIFSLYENSVSDNLYEMNRLIGSLKADSEIEGIQNTFNDAYYSLTDAMESLNNLRESMDISEEDINAMEERLFEIQKLKRKYGHTIADILKTRDDLERKVEAFTNRQAYLDAIDARIRKAEAEYRKAAEKLSAVRRNGAGKLDEDIIRHLRVLMLDNARFKTDIREGKPNRDGIDSVVFLISMNKGEDLKPLSAVASGGELSRLMLGLKVIFTHLQGISTVIFDEIDTGVSGAVATAIGQEMKRLSETCQVFAVTHLAPVAACADRQYLVAKKTDGTSARTSIHEMNEEERIDQLALIASGSVTEASRQAARELYQRNRSL